MADGDYILLKNNGSTIDEKILASEANKSIGFDNSKNPVLVSALKYIEIRIADKATDLAAGSLAGGDFRIPRVCTIIAVGAYVDTAGTGLLTLDINENGTSVLGTKLTIDASEKTSATAVVAYTLSDTSIAADAILTIDIDSVTGTVPKGLTVWLEVLM
jgi:hypothetical protein